MKISTPIQKVLYYLWINFNSCFTLTYSPNHNLLNKRLFLLLFQCDDANYIDIEVNIDFTFF